MRTAGATLADSSTTAASPTLSFRQACALLRPALPVKCLMPTFALTLPCATTRPSPVLLLRPAQGVFAGEYRSTLLYYVALFAGRDIPAGEELTYDYGEGKGLRSSPTPWLPAQQAPDDRVRKVSEVQVPCLLEAELGITSWECWEGGCKQTWHVDARSVTSCKPGRAPASRHVYTCLYCCKRTCTLLRSMLSVPDATCAYAAAMYSRLLQAGASGRQGHALPLRRAQL